MIRLLARITGLEKKIQKEERFKVSAELEECKAYLFGSNGDMIRKENPKLPKALDSICWMLTFNDRIDANKFRESIKNE